MYVIEVTLNDTTCAIFQVVTKQILHMADSEFEIFKPQSNPDNYYTFETLEEAKTWFNTWYQFQRNNYNKLPQQIPLPGKSAFRIIELTGQLKDNTYTILNTSRILDMA